MAPDPETLRKLKYEQAFAISKKWEKHDVRNIGKNKCSTIQIEQAKLCIINVYESTERIPRENGSILCAVQGQIFDVQKENL